MYQSRVVVASKNFLVSFRVAVKGSAKDLFNSDIFLYLKSLYDLQLFRSENRIFEPHAKGRGHLGKLPTRGRLAHGLYLFYGPLSPSMPIFILL